VVQQGVQQELSARVIARGSTVKGIPRDGTILGTARGGTVRDTVKDILSQYP
jgi:hypothetical protein